MPITTVDPKTALILVDLQNGIVATPTAEVIKQASALADVFRRHGLPVVLVHVTGGAPGRTEQPRNLKDMPDGWADFVPEINQHPEDYVVTKQTWGAFTHTLLEDHLRSLGVTQVVIAGVATSAGVESTARQAYELGFNVTLALDAMTDRSEEAHTNSVTRIFPKLAETGTTQEILGVLNSLLYPNNRDAEGEGGEPRRAG
jgi:nicotinamidase-related amidase